MHPRKRQLKENSVSSDTFHVGIELELRSPSQCKEHDDEGCAESYASMMRDNGAESILRDYLGLSRDHASEVASYFDLDQWVSDYMDGWSCDDSECSYMTGNEESEREELASELRELTGNRSFKVDSDSSINTNSDQVDTEVCWNYFASKETIKDNEKIIKFLNDHGCTFDKSCGLHINLNNYLNVPKVRIETKKLDFLFNFVAPSRRASTFCKTYGMDDREKYSMIYHQGSRLEFRFFSPTLDAEKLNHYVTLAHHVYKRLSGLDAKLPKKTMTYLLDKMIKQGISVEVAHNTLKMTNSIPIAEPKQLELMEVA